MLLLNSQAWTIEGLQVFGDHADPLQFWYLPGPVRLARRREDGRAEFTLIKVRAAVPGDPNAKGGGFLTFTTDLTLDPDLERRVLAKLAAFARGKARLSAVPFDEGSVRVVALDTDSGAASGGAPAVPLPAGAFRAVERALGATVPSLDSANRASFALTLTQEGVTILDKAFQKAGMPVGVLYELKFTGMRPALAVKITAEMGRVFDQFASGTDGQVLFVRGGIDQGFETLVQSGAIRIEVQDFVGAADRATKEQWAIDFFKDQLLQQYFTPSLTVGELRGGIPQPEALDAVLKRADALRPPATPVPAKPRDDEVVTRPTPLADPAASPTAGTGKGGTPANAVPNPPAGTSGAGGTTPTPAAAADASPTAHTGHMAGAADAAALGSAVGAGISPAVTTRAPGAPAAAVSPPATATPASTPPSSTSAAGSGSSQAVLSFRLRTIKQEERKTLTFSYARSEAVQRTYAPQGFFGLLTGDLAREGHFIEVDLDDPFFRVLDLRVSTLPDMAAIGLERVQVALSYGTPDDPGGVKTHDMEFKGQNSAEQSWKVAQNDGDEPVYRYTVQYHFAPDSGWEGASLSHEFGPVATSDRTLVLNPYERLGFAAIDIVAGKIDWGQIERIDVALGAAGRTHIVTLTEAAPNAAWKLRLPTPGTPPIEWTPTFAMKDRSRRTGAVQTAQGTKVVVDDPFPEQLALQLIPILDQTRTRLAFVDFDYADASSGFKRTERYRIAPTDLDKDVRIGLPAGATKRFRYRVTVVPIAGTMQTGEFVDATETLIAVAD